jgi:uncharacterized protein YjbI with pentapeptide repeats
LLDLSGADIYGEFKLPPTMVIERIELKGTTFHDNADFSHSVITETADFTDAVFLGEATFIDTKFEPVARFNGASFALAANFSDAVFADAASCGSTRFDGETKFHRTHFKQICSMLHTRFSGKVSFHYAKFFDAWDTAGAWCSADFNCHGITCEKVDGVGKIQVDGIANFHESRWLEHVSMDLRAPQISYEKATFQQGFDLIASGYVDLSQVRVGAASRVRGGLFWRMDSDHYVTNADGEPPMAAITSLRGADAEQLLLVHCDLSSCRFAGAHNLDKLHLDGKALFGSSPDGLSWTSRQTIADEHDWRAEHGWESWALEGRGHNRYWAKPDAQLIADIYRSLRKRQEDAKDSPGASDFYYGEMEMRRHAGHDSGNRYSWIETRLVFFYWLLAGYGLRASRSLGWLVAIVLAAAVPLSLWGFHDPGQNYGRSLLFAIQSSVSLRRAPEASLAVGGEVVELALRLTGPVLFGLALLSLRGRLRR